MLARYPTYTTVTTSQQWGVDCDSHCTRFRPGPVIHEASIESPAFTSKPTPTYGRGSIQSRRRVTYQHVVRTLRDNRQLLDALGEKLVAATHRGPVGDARDIGMPCFRAVRWPALPEGG